MEAFELFIFLLIIIAALAHLSRSVRTPYPVLLVVAGLCLSFIPRLPRIHLPPDLVFVIFFPPLLYPAALFTPWRDFRANLRPILLLAIGLVLATSTAVAFVAHHYIAGFPLAAGFVLGAIVSPPDAVAVTAIAGLIRVPRRIIVVLEGESLVNDATALVIYRFAVAAVVGGSFSMPAASGLFFLVSAGGIAVGLAWGWIVAKVQRKLNDAPIQITISLITPFMTYLIAERCGFSGVLAVVTAGLFVGWRAPEIIGPASRLQLNSIWEMITFLLEGFLFLFIGLELPDIIQTISGRWLKFGGYVAIMVATVIVVRIVWVFVATYIPRLLIPAVRKKDPYPDWRHVTLTAWTGMRGADSLAAAIALPFVLPSGAPFPGRDEILILTFFIIFATLVLQGGTLPMVIRWLGIKGDNLDDKEEHIARTKANGAALTFLSQTDVRKRYAPEIVERLRAEYQDRLRELQICGSGGCTEEHEMPPGFDDLEREALRTERRMIIALRNEGAINDDALRAIQRDLDLAEARLDGE
jgi:CPA1 family monovalent cation:H+ antiporter